jgi:Fic family protein
MENIQQGGIYRNVDVYISGAEHVPPSPLEMYCQIKNFYLTIDKNFNSSIEKAAYVHAEFVKIHPFIDGNGRTSRLIMNYVLMQEDYLPISISKESKMEYYKTLDVYATQNDINPFADLIAELEEKRLDFYISQIDRVKNID